MTENKDLFITPDEHKEFLKETTFSGKMKILLKHSKKNEKRIKEKSKMAKEPTEQKQKEENFFKKAFREMGESARAQHEVDKANFAAVKAESRATFEENRGTNSWKKAKEIGKQSWDDAHISPAERTARTRENQAKQIEEANARKVAAEERYEQAKVTKNKKK